MAQTPLPLRFPEAPDVPVIGAACGFQPQRSSTRSAHRARNLMRPKVFVTFIGVQRRGQRHKLEPKPLFHATRRSRQ